MFVLQFWNSSVQTWSKRIEGASIETYWSFAQEELKRNWNNPQKSRILFIKLLIFPTNPLRSTCCAQTASISSGTNFIKHKIHSAFSIPFHSISCFFCFREVWRFHIILIPVSIWLHYRPWQYFYSMAWNWKLPESCYSRFVCGCGSRVSKNQSMSRPFFAPFWVSREVLLHGEPSFRIHEWFSSACQRAIFLACF